MRKEYYMARKKSALKGFLKFFDDLTPSKSNPNLTKGSMRRKNAAKRRKKR